MAIYVNTNTQSLNSQRMLSNSSATLNKALTRLSSGLRINSAADDAAGMAISSNMTSQFRGFNQAIRNANDGLSLLGTAESSMVEQTNILQRVRELAVQSASDTNSASNRKALNDEVTQLKSELDRIASTVQFNGINLLDGTFTSKELQVGAYSGANERISIDISSTRAAALGQAYKLTGTAAATTNALTAGGVTITSNGETINVGASADDGISTVGGTYSAAAKAAAINAVNSKTGVTATASTSATAGAAVTAGTLNSTDSLKINGVQIDASGLTAGEVGATALATAINAVKTQTGVTAATDGSGKLVLSAADGRNIDVATAGNGATISGLTAGTTVGKLELSGYGEYSVGGSQVADLGAGVTGSALKDATQNVNTIDLSTKDSSNTAIKIVDAALNNLNSARSKIGALNNRITTTIANLGAAAENAAASNSRIVDADFAAETANMTKAQILQQAGVSVLSQANQTPQLALSLLR